MPSIPNLSELTPGVNAISFKSQGFEVAAHLHLPADFDAAGTLPAILFASPGLSVKEQSGAVYGRSMAARGYALLSFDRLGFGQSEGPFTRCLNQGPNNELHLDALSFLRSLPFVDRDRVFGLGVCIGSIDLTRIACADKRIRALATVSGIVAAAQQFFSQEREVVVAALTAANEARQRHYESGDMGYEDTIATAEIAQNMPAGSAVRQGFEYYKGFAGAGAFPGYSSMGPANFTESLAYCDVLPLAPYLYTPFLGVVGSEADTRGDTETFYAAASEPKALFVVEGATHVDLYHREPYVAAVADRIDAFFAAS